MKDHRSDFELEALRTLITNLSGVTIQLQADTKLFLDIAKQKRDNLAQEDIVDVCFWFKCLAKSFLAQVDGTCWMMRQAVVRHASQFNLDLNEKKLDRISEQKHQLSFVEGVKIALRTFPMIFDLRFRPEFSDIRFEAFRRFVNYRNALSHPGLLVDTSPLGLLQVTRPAIGWFMTHLRQLLVECCEVASIPLAAMEDDSKSYFCRPEQLEGIDQWTLDLLEDPLSRPASEQFSFFLDSLLADLSKSLNFWKRGNPSQAVLHSRQAEMRNYLRFLMSGLEGGVLAASSALQNSGVATSLSGARHLRGSPDEIAELTLRIAEAFSARLGNGSELSRADRGWQSLPTCRVVRNRVTHPENLTELAITQSEVRAIFDLSSWFAGPFLRSLDPSDSAVWETLRSPLAQ